MTADSPLSFGYFQRIWSLRYFWFSLVVNDIRSRYRRSLLGVGWSLLRPLCMTGIFCLVFGTIFNHDLANYAPYVLIGMTTWQFLSESLVVGCHSFTAGAAYIRQQRVPGAIFPLRTVLGAGFHFAVALMLGIVITAYFKGLPSPAALAFLPISILVLLALGWSLAIISGVAQTHFPDTIYLLEIGMQILFYLTPIMYSTEDFKDRHRLTKILELNPIHSVLQLFRKPLLDGELPPLLSVIVSLGFAAAAMLAAWLLLRRLERTLVFWV